MKNKPKKSTKKASLKPAQLESLLERLAFELPRHTAESVVTQPLTKKEVIAYENLLRAILFSQQPTGSIVSMLELVRKMKTTYTHRIGD